MKIKSNITKYIIELINSLIKKNNEQNKKIPLLLPLKYELISRPMGKIFNMELLNQPIYKILSNDISGRFPKLNYYIIFRDKNKHPDSMRLRENICQNISYGYHGYIVL